jgi:hypothetical protein
MCAAANGRYAWLFFLEENVLAKIPQVLHEQINTAYPANVCLIGTVLPNGFAQITPRGSTMVFDDEHIALWERGKGTTTENLTDGTPVTIFMRKPALREAGILPKGGILRLYGQAKIHNHPLGPRLKIPAWSSYGRSPGRQSWSRWRRRRVASSRIALMCSRVGAAQPHDDAALPLSIAWTEMTRATPQTQTHVARFPPASMLAMVQEPKAAPGAIFMTSPSLAVPLGA